MHHCVYLLLCTVVRVCYYQHRLGLEKPTAARTTEQSAKQRLKLRPDLTVLQNCYCAKAGFTPMVITALNTTEQWDHLSLTDGES